MGVDETLLDEIVRRVLSVARPDMIILFGSAATGQTSKDSEIDLLVVLREIVRPVPPAVGSGRSRKPSTNGGRVATRAEISVTNGTVKAFGDRRGVMGGGRSRARTADLLLVRQAL